jgi:hypothetical protein
LTQDRGQTRGEGHREWRRRSHPRPTRKALLQERRRTTTSPSPTKFGSTRSIQKTAHHAGQCEFVGETDPAVLKVLLKVQEREGYWWTESAACEAGWQVPHYAKESVG